MFLVTLTADEDANVGVGVVAEGRRCWEEEICRRDVDGGRRTREHDGQKKNESASCKGFFESAALVLGGIGPGEPRFAGLLDCFIS